MNVQQLNAAQNLFLPQFSFQISAHDGFLGTHVLSPHQTLGLIEGKVPAILFDNSMNSAGSTVKSRVLPLFDFGKPRTRVRNNFGTTMELEVVGLEPVGLLGDKIIVFNAKTKDDLVIPLGCSVDEDRGTKQWIMFARMGYSSVRVKALSRSGYLAGEITENLSYGIRHGLFRATASHFHVIHGAAGQSLRVHHIDDHGEMAIVTHDGPYLQSLSGRVLRLKKNGPGEESAVHFRAGDFPTIGTVCAMGQTKLALWYPKDVRVDVSWRKSPKVCSESLIPRGLLTAGQLGTDLIVLGDAVLAIQERNSPHWFNLLARRSHRQNTAFLMLKRGAGEDIFDLNDLVTSDSGYHIDSIAHLRQIGREVYVLTRCSATGSHEQRTAVIKTTLRL